MARCAPQASVSTGGSRGVAAIRDASSTASVASSAESGPAPPHRPGPDTDREVHPVPLHGNASGAEQAPVDGLIRTRYTLDVCVVCGHERIQTPGQEASCPQCGGSAGRSFALFRGLREVQR